MYFSASARKALPLAQAPRALAHNRRVEPRPAPITHYENFPVASLLCPPRLRPAIAAIYHFARTADDIADEGQISADERLADLCAYAAELHAVAAGQPPAPRWAAVFGPLQLALQRYQLPVPLLADLLDAFGQDVEKTRAGAGYADRAELLDYCRRSANPIGRLLLHLYGVHGAAALHESDAICTALQLINFWQDLSVDIPRGRYYLCAEDCARHGVRQADVLALRLTPEISNLIADYADWTSAIMQKGLQLVHRVPGRMGWELRLVVQGGLRVLAKVQALRGASLHTRARLHAWDAAPLLWRALRM